MPTIAIVGAGPGMGMSIAKAFGRNGYQVALLSRSQEKLDDLAGQLAEGGIDAAGFAADVQDRPSLVKALARVKDRFGPVDVLEYSPAPHVPIPGLEMVDTLELTVENVQPQIDYYLYGAMTAVREVLPDMIAASTGTLLFTTGASSVLPVPQFGNVSIGGAALRKFAHSLNASLAEKGAYAAHVAIGLFIGSGGPETQPGAIAELYWELHTKRDEVERLYTVPGAMDNITLPEG
jgi:NAD(P)-dependent dehydrogenase (short-subunit alcohol dehydrogenase family)